MVNIYDFVDQCRDADLTPEEADREYARACAEERERFFDDYYNDPVVCEGLAQQDMIDMYRRER